MMGVSYGGISQLFVGATRPPDLAAIAPLSVIDNTQTTLYPGGVLNTGLRAPVGEGPGPRREPAVADRRPAVGLRADPGRRRGLQGKPGAASRGGRPARKISATNYYRPKVADPLSPITFVHKINVPGLPRLPVDRRADRRPLPDAAGAVHRDRPQVVHVHQRRPHGLARPGDLQPLVRLPRALRRAAKTAARPDAARRLAPVIYQTALGVHGVTLPDDPIQHEPDYASALAAFEAQPPGPGPVRQRRRRRHAGLPAPGLRAVVHRLPGAGHQARLVLPRRRRRADATKGPASPAPRPFTLGPDRPAADGLHRQHRAAARTGCGRRRPPTTGRRTRPAPRSHT